MVFQKEAESFDVLAVKLDMAFRAGIYGLNDARDICANINTVVKLFNSEAIDIVGRLASPPVGITQETIFDNHQEEAEEVNENNDQTQSVPGTKHKIAKPI